MANILVIDDDPMNRDILRMRLEGAGHQVWEAPDGEEGLQLSLSCKPDLIFLDLMMPLMDGWQVCRKLRSAEMTKHIPIIMLTARDQKIDQLRGWESGANEYLVKPWEVNTLIELTAKYLQPR